MSQVNAKIISESNLVEIKLYIKRWFILAALVVLVFIAVLNHVMFGIVNNVIVAYFDTTYETIDLIGLGPCLGTIATTPILAWLSFKEMITCRKLMTVASLVLSVNSICALLAFIKPSLFGLLIFGQIFGGIAFAIVFVIPTVLAQLWFPENQIGIAIGSIMIGSSGMGIVAYDVLPFLIQDPSQTNLSTYNFTSISEFKNLSWQQHNKTIFEVLYTIQLVIIFLITVFLIFFVPEKPEKPPSYAQYLKRNTQKLESLEKINFVIFLKQTKQLWSDYVFVSYAILTGLMYNLIGLDSVIMEQIVHYTSFLSSSTLSANAIAGLIMTCYCIGTASGNLISGKLLDKCKKYYIQSIIGSTCLTIAMIITTLSLIYKIATSCFIGYVFNGVSTRICLIAIMDSIMQHTYPQNELFVTSWVVFIQNISAVLIIELGRVIFERFFTDGVLSYLCVVSFFTIIVTILCKPSAKRLNAEQSANENTNEATPLNP